MHSNAKTFEEMRRKNIIKIESPNEKILLRMENFYLTVKHLLLLVDNLTCNRRL